MGNRRATAAGEGGLRTRSGETASAGFALLEVLIVALMSAVAMVAVSMSLAAGSGLGEANAQSARARARAQSAMEALKAAPFSTVFAAFNALPGDDPGGAGMAPGAAFDVQGLRPAPDDVDGRVGSIEFPGGAAELREDVWDDQMGMPRDLSGDGVIDALDHAALYVVLPVRVRVRWLGATGVQEVVLVTTLVDM